VRHNESFLRPPLYTNFRSGVVSPILAQRAPRQRAYPSFIAHTDSSANPKPSPCLRVSPQSAGLCRLLSAPAESRTFLTLSLRFFLYVPRALGASEPRAWTPTPSALGVISPVSSSKTLAFPALGQGRRFASFRANDFFRTVRYFEAAVIRFASGPQFCSPLRSSPPCDSMFTQQLWLFHPNLARPTQYDTWRFPKKRLTSSIEYGGLPFCCKSMHIPPRTVWAR